MINDGGAERMVRKRKPEWWQILAIVIMMLFIGLIFLAFFFLMNGEIFVNALNKATVKDGYAILSEVKTKYPDIAVTEYEQTDTSVKIDFKYYDTVLEKELDLLALSYEVKGYMEEYLASHPDNFMIEKQMRVELRFPELVFTNIPVDGEFTFTPVFNNVSYRYSDMKFEDFMKDISVIKKADSLIFEAGDSTLSFGEYSDMKFVEAIEGLKTLKIEKNDLTSAEKDSIKELCKKNDIACEIE